VPGIASTTDYTVTLRYWNDSNTVTLKWLTAGTKTVYSKLYIKAVQAQQQQLVNNCYSRQTILAMVFSFYYSYERHGKMTYDAEDSFLVPIPYLQEQHFVAIYRFDSFCYAL
jgi:hypothetical protein